MIYVIIKYIKTKENKYLYLSFYCFIAFPIIENYHTMLAFIPIFGYFLNELDLNQKIISCTFILFILMIFAINSYKIYKNEYIYPNITNEYKYRKLLPSDAKSIKLISQYVNTIDEKIYLITSTAYLIKLEGKISINKFDLLNNGNLGLNGDEKLIDEIKQTCEIEKCTFIVDITDTINPELTQFNQRIIHYIIDNYKDYGKIYNYELTIYKNY